MKKIVLIILALVLAISLIACNNTEAVEEDGAGVADYAKPIREHSVEMVIGSETVTVGTLTYEDGVGDTATITKYVGLFTAHPTKIDSNVGEGISARVVTKIGDEAFYYCTAITSIELPETLTSIGDWAFAGCTGIETIVIPAEVTSIGKGAFNGCTNLKSVIFEEGSKLKSIDDYAFNDCTSLETITIPEGVESIGAKAFGGCEKITSIKTPASLQSIGDLAFYGCTGLNAEGALDVSASVNIAIKVENIGGEKIETVCIGKYVFAGIKKDYIIVPEDAECEMAKYVAAMRDTAEE